MALRSQSLRVVVGCGAAVFLWAGVTAALAWGTTGAVADLRASGPATFDSLLAVAAASAAWACLTWLAVALLLSLLSGLPRYADGFVARLRDAIAPWAVRRLVGTVLGIAAVSVPVAAAGATPAIASVEASAGVASISSVAEQPRAGFAVTASLDRPGSAPEVDRPLGDGWDKSTAAPSLPGWTPDRPAAAPRQAAADSLALVTTRPHPRHGAGGAVAVRRGDTLWDIAERALGPDADPLDVARAWPKWYAANRAVIGPDPGLLMPGTVLTPPSQAA